MSAVYFGCWERVGHYYWLPGMRRPPREVGGALSHSITPWGLGIDGKLTPKSSTSPGAASVCHKDGWTALAVHDYSVDDRGGSNSVFAFDAHLDFGQALAAAREHFPEVVARIGSITEVAP